jgi:hypothetical protein
MAAMKMEIRGLFFALVWLLAGCGTSYTPSQLAHVYTTDTQRHHLLTGIRFVSKPLNNRVQHIGEQLLFLTKQDMKIYVDGRVARVANTGADSDTLVQLPPGDHVVAIQMVERSVITLGMEISDSLKEYRVTLREGEVVTATPAWLPTGVEYVQNGVRVREHIPGLEFDGTATVSELR